MWVVKIWNTPFKIFSMKHSIFILFLGLSCFISTSNAQKESDSSTTRNNKIISDEMIEVRFISPHAIGSHFLSKAYNQNQAGVDIYANLYSMQNFKFGMGHTRFGSELTNASLAGNFKRVSYRSYYLQLAYMVFQSKDFETGVAVGYGANFFRQRTSNTRRGSYTAGEIRTGLYANYQFLENLGVSFGINYLTTLPNIKSAEQGGNLFGRTHVIYPFFGFYFNI